MSTLVDSTVRCPKCGAPEATQTFDTGDSESTVSCPQCGYFCDTARGDTLPELERMDPDDAPELDYTLTFSSQEINTLLAALRYYQANGQGDPAKRSSEIHDIATNGDSDISLDADGIDELCERINLG